MATMSRFTAVAKMGQLEISGFIAWVAWLAMHLMYLVGFRRKISTLLSWTVTFLGRGRAQMASTEQQVSREMRWASWSAEQGNEAAAESSRGSKRRCRG